MVGEALGCETHDPIVGPDTPTTSGSSPARCKETTVCREGFGDELNREMQGGMQRRKVEAWDLTLGGLVP